MFNSVHELSQLVFRYSNQIYFSYLCTSYTYYTSIHISIKRRWCFPCNCSNPLARYNFWRTTPILTRYQIIRSIRRLWLKVYYNTFLINQIALTNGPVSSHVSYPNKIMYLGAFDVSDYFPLPYHRTPHPPANYKAK